MLEEEYKLIKQAKKGKSESFGLLYDHYLPQIYRFILLKTGNKTETEDLAHEVFMSAWQNIGGYVDKGFPFSSWLYQIARNRVIDHYRTKKISYSLDEMDDDKFDAEEDIDKNIDHLLSMELVRNAIKSLPEEHQTVIVLRFVEDVAPGDIAELMGKSEGAVRLMQHRALKKLKNIIAQSANPEHEA